MNSQLSKSTLNKIDKELGPCEIHSQLLLVKSCISITDGFVVKTYSTSLVHWLPGISPGHWILKFQNCLLSLPSVVSSLLWSFLISNEPLVNMNLISGIFEGMFNNIEASLPFLSKWWIRDSGNSSYSRWKIMGDYVTYSSFNAYLSFQYVKSMTSRLSPDVNYVLWVIMICQHQSINYNKCTTLVENVGNQGYYTCMELGVYGK